MKNLFRLFVINATLALCGSIAGAQVEPTRIGVLGAPEEPRFSEVVSGLKQGLRDLGYSENSFEILEGRVTRGKERDGGRKGIEELAHKKAQVLFVIGSRLIRTARQAAADLPIVFITPGDPVAAGLYPVSHTVRLGKRASTVVACHRKKAPYSLNESLTSRSSNRSSGEFW